MMTSDDDDGLFLHVLFRESSNFSALFLGSSPYADTCVQILNDFVAHHGSLQGFAKLVFTIADLARTHTQPDARHTTIMLMHRLLTVAQTIVPKPSLNDDAVAVMKIAYNILAEPAIALAIAAVGITLVPFENEIVAKAFAAAAMERMHVPNTIEERFAIEVLRHAFSAHPSVCSSLAARLLTDDTEGGPMIAHILGRIYMARGPLSSDKSLALTAIVAVAMCGTDALLLDVLHTVGNETANDIVPYVEALGFVGEAFAWGLLTRARGSVTLALHMLLDKRKVSAHAAQSIAAIAVRALSLVLQAPCKRSVYTGTVCAADLIKLVTTVYENGIATETETTTAAVATTLTTPLPPIGRKQEALQMLGMIRGQWYESYALCSDTFERTIPDEIRLTTGGGARLHIATALELIDQRTANACAAGGSAAILFHAFAIALVTEFIKHMSFVRIDRDDRIRGILLTKTVLWCGIHASRSGSVFEASAFVDEFVPILFTSTNATIIDFVLSAFAALGIPEITSSPLCGAICGHIARWYETMFGFIPAAIVLGMQEATVHDLWKPRAETSAYTSTSLSVEDGKSLGGGLLLLPAPATSLLSSSWSFMSVVTDFISSISLTSGVTTTTAEEEAARPPSPPPDSNARFKLNIQRELYADIIGADEPDEDDGSQSTTSGYDSDSDDDDDIVQRLVASVDTFAHVSVPWSVGLIEILTAAVSPTLVRESIVKIAYASVYLISAPIEGREQALVNIRRAVDVVNAGNGSSILLALCLALSARIPEAGPVLLGAFKDRRDNANSVALDAWICKIVRDVSTTTPDTAPILASIAIESAERIALSQYAVDSMDELYKVYDTLSALCDANAGSFPLLLSRLASALMLIDIMCKRTQNGPNEDVAKCTAEMIQHVTDNTAAYLSTSWCCAETVAVWCCRAIGTLAKTLLFDGARHDFEWYERIQRVCEKAANLFVAYNNNTRISPTVLHAAIHAMCAFREDMRIETKKGAWQSTAKSFAQEVTRYQAFDYDKHVLSAIACVLYSVVQRGTVGESASALYVHMTTLIAMIIT